MKTEARVPFHFILGCEDMLMSDYRSFSNMCYPDSEKMSSIGAYGTLMKYERVLAAMMEHPERPWADAARYWESLAYLSPIYAILAHWVRLKLEAKSDDEMYVRHEEHRLLGDDDTIQEGDELPVRHLVGKRTWKAVDESLIGRKYDRRLMIITLRRVVAGRKEIV